MNNDIKKGIILAERVLEYSDSGIAWQDHVVKTLAQTIMLMRDEIDYLKGRIQYTEEFENTDVWNEIRD